MCHEKIEQYLFDLALVCANTRQLIRQGLFDADVLFYSAEGFGGLSDNLIEGKWFDFISTFAGASEKLFLEHVVDQAAKQLLALNYHNLQAGLFSRVNVI